MANFAFTKARAPEKENPYEKIIKHSVRAVLSYVYGARYGYCGR